jgi:hypothetical protein
MSTQLSEAGTVILPVIGFPAEVQTAPLQTPEELRFFVVIVEHVPLALAPRATLHASHEAAVPPPQAVLQHTPVTQKPLAH